MAKKRKKEKVEKEEYEFRPPEFDEKEFLKKEISDTKTAVITIVYASALGIVAGLLTTTSGSLVGPAFLVGIAGMVALRYAYPMLKVDISQFQKRNWLGNLGMYFFTFLAVWILLLNMPFSDHASPTVDKVIVWVDNGTAVRGIEYEFVEAQGGYVWTVANSTNPDDVKISVSHDRTVNITAKVTDNGHLKTVRIAIGAQDSPYHDMISEGGYRYGYMMDVSGNLTAGTSLTFYISAEDRAGNSVLFFPATAIPVTS
jgi:hypothetical protein